MGGDHPTYWIDTWGCQMNDADSAAVARLLEGCGYVRAASAKEADLILLNTCCVRAKPEEKVYSRLGELRALKRRRPETVIAVAGCMAQKEGDSLRRRAPHIDLILGTQRLHRLPALAQQAQGTGHAETDVLLSADPAGQAPSWLGSTPIPDQPLKALVNVMQGCTNFCAYCIVPYVRGPERSRRAEEIVCEIEALTAGGCREVTLLGQNILAYGRDLSDGSDFVELLTMVNGIAGLQRIRFTTSHPRDVNDRVIEAVADLPKVCEHLHLPLQAGDDELLRRMNRGCTVEQYLGLADRLRERVPGVSLTTDLVVGFPGETEEQFERSLETYRRIRFDQAFTFAYSPREGTAAASLPGQLSRADKQSRLARLIALQNEISTAINREWVGRTVKVMVEGPSESNPDRLMGRARNNKVVILPKADLAPGALIEAHLTQGRLWGWEGEFA